MSLTPRTFIEAIYSGVDISRDVSGDLVSMTYTDNESSKSDDVSLTLRNDHGKWSGPWMPIEGDKLTLTIIKQTAEGVKRLPCGVCTIDEIKTVGKPSVLEINAASVPINTTIRRQQKSRAWENVKLSEIATDIAATGGIELLYLIDNDPEFDRRDQRDETDLQFLQRVCDDYGFKVKVTDSQLVTYDPVAMENLPPVKTYKLFNENVLSYDFTSQAHDIYKTIIVEYSDPQTGKLNEYTYQVPDVERGGEFKITQRCETIAEAEKLAKATAHRKNRRKISGTLSVVGDTDLSSGLTIRLVGFGNFDGVYYITKAEHTVGGGYVTSVEINRVDE